MNNLQKLLRLKLSELKLNKMLGSANRCPKCRKKGNFGSIHRIDGDGKMGYLACGWCGKISKVKEL